LKIVRKYLRGNTMNDTNDLKEFFSACEKQNIKYERQGNTLLFSDYKSEIKAIQLLADMGMFFSQTGKEIKLK